MLLRGEGVMPRVRLSPSEARAKESEGRREAPTRAKTRTETGDQGGRGPKGPYYPPGRHVTRDS